MTNIEKWEELFNKEYEGQYNDFSTFCCNGEYCMKNCGKTLAEELKSLIRTLLQTEQTRIAEEVEKTSIEWEDSKDELYTYFGKCSCGETSVIVGSKYCYGCGKLIKNPLRSSEVLSIIKQGKHKPTPISDLQMDLEDEAYHAKIDDELSFNR